MGRRAILLGGMWISALAVVVVLSFGDRERRRERPVVSPEATPGAAGAGAAHAVASRRALPVPEAGEGPPRAYRGDARHTGRSPFVGPRAGRVRWVFAARGPLFGQAVVGRDGRVVFGDLAGWLHVVAKDGSLLWERDLGGAIYGTPLLDDDGAIFVGCDADALWAFEPDGAVRFVLPTEGDADSGVARAPDGSLRFAAGEELWSIDREGRVRWRFRAGGTIFSTPVVDSDGAAYVGAQDDRLHAVGADGRLLWSFAAGADVDSSPLLGDDGTLYFGSDDGRVHALDRDGRPRFARDVGGHVRAPLGLGAAGTLLASVFGPRPRLIALDALTGEERWSFALGAAGGEEEGSHSGPTSDREGFVYVGGHDDFVYALGPDGALRFAVPTLGDVDAPPAIGPDGVLYVGARDQRLYAIE